MVNWCQRAKRRNAMNPHIELCDNSSKRLLEDVSPTSISVPSSYQRHEHGRGKRWRVFPPVIPDVPSVCGPGSLGCSGRGSACPGSGVGKRDQSTSPARPFFRSFQSALPDAGGYTKPSVRRDLRQLEGTERSSKPQPGETETRQALASVLRIRLLDPARVRTSSFPV